jgi:hypothetical protein
MKRTTLFQYAGFLFLVLMSNNLRSQPAADDFTDGDFTANPAWSGNTDNYAVITDSPVPGGNALSDGSFLASNASVGHSVLQTASGLPSEWRFSLATPNFDPASTNYFGVILFSNTELNGDITAASWNGYYLRIGVNGSTDHISLYRNSGASETLVGDFPDSPILGTGALRDGLNIRVTRSASGVFELFYETGFEYITLPTTSAGTLTDNTHSTSSFFGVFTRFNNPAASRRVYLDNLALFDAPAISNITRTPKVPLDNQNATITASVTDNDGISAVTLFYRVNGGSTQNLAMSNSGGDTYQAVISAGAYGNGDRVEHWISAEDNTSKNGEISTSDISAFFAGTISIATAHAVNASGVMLYNGYAARLTGVATVASGIFSTAHLDVYLQDGSGGINLFKLGAGSTNIILGNSYTAVGNLFQFNGKAEIIPDDAQTDITNNGAGTLPPPLIRTIDQLLNTPETYEGMLIGIQHVENTDNGDPWPMPGNSANVEISDGSGELILRVDNDTDLDENPEPAWPKDVAGIFNQFDTSSPFDGGYQVLPRSIADIFADGSLPVTLSSFIATAGDGSVRLQWVTESEVQNLGFKVLRSEHPAGMYLELSSYENNPDLAGQFNSNVAHTYSFTDNLVVNGVTYWYKLVDVDANNRQTEHGPVSATPSLLAAGNMPQVFALHPNYPNPFNPGTIIPFDVPANDKNAAPVKMIIYNALGQPVKTIVDDVFETGEFTAYWGGDDDSGQPVSGGIYFAVFTAGNFRQAMKLVLLR